MLYVMWVFYFILFFLIFKFFFFFIMSQISDTYFYSEHTRDGDTGIVGYTVRYLHRTLHGTLLAAAPGVRLVRHVSEVQGGGGRQCWTLSGICIWV